ncbi:MAG: OmpH family outer membrane protein [Phycisphaerales bacterium]|nr:OmpH family outer membrane protein [Phycisphaerales bacterium]
MKTQERCVVYGLLLACLLAVLGRPLATPADAQPAAEADLTGPTDGIVLRQAEGDDLMLTAADDHVSYGTDPWHRVYSMAVCDVLAVAQAVVNRPAYQEQLDEFAESAEEALTPMREELRRLRDAIQAAPDPATRDELRRRGQELATAYQQEERRLYGEQEQLRAEMMAEAYRLAEGAVHTVADELGIDIVLATRDSEKEINAITTPNVFSDTLARVAVRHPEEINITAEVMDELDL